GNRPGSEDRQANRAARDHDPSSSGGGSVLRGAHLRPGRTGRPSQGLAGHASTTGQYSSHRLGAPVIWPCRADQDGPKSHGAGGGTRATFIRNSPPQERPMTNLAWLGKQSRPLAWILGLVLLIAATGCDRSAKAAKTTEAPPPTPVIVADVVERAVPIYREYTARTEAVPTIEVRARVAGVLEEVLFKE